MTAAPGPAAAAAVEVVLEVEEAVEADRISNLVPPP